MKLDWCLRHASNDATATESNHWCHGVPLGPRRPAPSCLARLTLSPGETYNVDDQLDHDCCCPSPHDVAAAQSVH